MIVETVIVGVLLLGLMVVLAVATFVLYRALNRIQGNLRMMRRSMETQEKAFTAIGAALGELNSLFGKLEVLLAARATADRERWKEGDQQHAAQSKAIEEFSGHAKEQKDLIAGLIKAARAMVAATVGIETTARIFTKQAFGGGAPEQVPFEEENEIRTLMQRDGMSRRDAEIVMAERRAENVLDGFNIER
jgi:ABC-type multidrug transport system fused ATPase/permease subunit